MNAPVPSNPPADVDTAGILAECCAQLRRGRRAESSLTLQVLLGRLDSLLVERPACLTPELQQAVARALDHQRRGDLIALADEIEFVVFPSLIGSPSSRDG